MFVTISMASPRLYTGFSSIADDGGGVQTKGGVTVVEPRERSWRMWVRPFIVPGFLLSLVSWLLVLVWLALQVVQATLTLGVHVFAAR